MLSKFSVKRPYTVLVGVVMILVLGFVSYSRMTADLLPDMSFPYVIVITTDIGASPEEVEADVTSKLEATLATTSNLKTIQSMSRNSVSTIILEYEQTSNMDSTMIELQQKLDQISGSFSDSVGSPMLLSINPDMLPIMVAAVGVDDMDATAVSTYVDNSIVPQLESIEGVASVTASGGVKEMIQVSLNQEKIDKLNQRVLDEIEDRFKDATQEIENNKDKIEDGKKELENGKEKLADQISQGETMLNTQKIQLYTSEAEMKRQLVDLQSTSQGLDQAVNNLTQISNGAIQLKDGIQKLDAGITEMKTLQEQLAQVAALPDEQLEAATGMTREQYNTRVAELTTGITAAEVQKKALEDQLAQLDSQVALVGQNMGQQLEAYNIKLVSTEDLPEAIKALEGAKVQVATGIATIEAAQKQIDAGKVTIDDALTALNKNEILGALQLSDASMQMISGSAALETAEKSVTDAKTQALDQADLNTVLSADVVRQLLVAQNMELPAGYIRQGDDSYLIKVGDSIDTVDALTNLVLIDMGMDSLGKVYLSDITDIEVQSNADSVYAKVNGKPGILLSFEKQTGYATGDVTDAILAKFDSLEKSEDQSIHFSTLMDQGVYIDLIVKSILQNMLLGAVLAILVLIIFLKDFRPTLIIACAIPLSVVFALVLMYFSNISLNIISMSGLALGIGMLVDNSIVVIENIYRLHSQGMSIKKACVNGASQVAGAITASTLTTVCVFAPIIFTEGITRQLFVDMGLTILYTLGASLIVALTLVPAMAQGVLRRPREIRHGLYDRFLNWYGKALRKTLRFKAIVFLLVIALLGVSVFMAMRNGTAFMPEMSSTQATVTLSPPEGENREFEEMTGYADQLMANLEGEKDIKTIGAMVGGGGIMASMGGMDMGGGSSNNTSSTRVTMYVLLNDDSRLSNDEFEEMIMKAGKDLNCEVKVNTAMMDMSALTGSGISLQVRGRDLEVLQDLARLVSGAIENVDGVAEVDDGLSKVEKEVVISVDKEKAAKYGMTVAQIFQLVYTKTAQSTSNMTLNTATRDYEVYVNSAEQAAMTVEDLKKITFTYKNRLTQEETEVKITDVATFSEREELTTINREAQTRFLNITAKLKDGYNVGLVGNDIEKVIKGLDIPEGYNVKVGGENEAINDAMSQLMLMMLLAVVLIYLIMVAQFQSLLSPFIIMFTIPLAFTGGFLTLALTGNEVSVIALIGFVMLAGIIVNNGIVLVDYINQLRREGMSKKDAIIESSTTRLRPVLMTALTTIISMFTMAIGMGRGTEMAQPMALVVVGGLVYGTLLTLVVVPCIYDAFNREKDMREEDIELEKAPEDPDLMDEPVQRPAMAVAGGYTEQAEGMAQQYQPEKVEYDYGSDEDEVLHRPGESGSDEPPYGGR